MNALRICLVVSTAGVLCAATGADESPRDYPIQAIPFDDVRLSEGFWASRLNAHRETTVPHVMAQCEETGRVDNFRKAAGEMEGKFLGPHFNDSDVYKVIEGVSRVLSVGRDPELERRLDDWIAAIAAAQEDDGYLYTARTVDPENPPPAAGKARWEKSRAGSHELYCVGHMYEAAVAHYRATGKRSLLDVAIRSADLVDRVFGPEKNRAVPGHQEIEIGLVSLYRATGEVRYLEAAKSFLDLRGRDGRGPGSQDHEPVIEQKEAVGHAVRACYMYCAMADVAALLDDAQYLKAVDRIWSDIVSKKLSLTGGVGARRGGEAFGEAYELPNATAYNETCGAIANAMLNHRLFLLHGDAKYIDVMERVLYNGLLAGISLEGDAFFYPNPLATDGKRKFNQGARARQPWFKCACCPSNVARATPAIPGYAYAQRAGALYVNYFMSGEAVVEIDGQTVKVRQGTRYPWDGAVKIVIEPTTAAEFTVYVRIPGWARNQPVPGDLYRYLGKAPEKPTLQVNGRAADLGLEKGFARLRRTWRPGDAIELDLPMAPRRVLSHKKVTDNTGRVALERGPIVYCAEGVDNDGEISNRFLPDEAALRAQWREDLLGGVVTLEGRAPAVVRGENGQLRAEAGRDFVAVPYYAWAHRGDGEMAVWLARQADSAAVPPAPTIASTSRVSTSYQTKTASAVLETINDLTVPRNSFDKSKGFFHWWPRKGGVEWIQYDLAKPATVRAVEVYWFDDTGKGGCRTPVSWRVLWREGDQWRPVTDPGAYGVKKDRFNRTTFDPVATDALRLEVRLRPEFSAGVIEWRVEEKEGR
jgi:DUF1680 family protein